MLCTMHGHKQTPSVPPPTKGAFRPLVACCSPVVGLWVSSLFLLLDLHVIPIKETRDWCIFVTWFHILRIFIHLVLL
jgi:hypothetical protein